MDARNDLNIVYLGQWIGRGSTINWPARSSVLSYLDFFLWGHMKSLIYEDSSVDSAEGLVARISVTATTIREMPGVFPDVQRSFHRRFEACALVGRCNFEQFL